MEANYLSWDSYFWIGIFFLTLSKQFFFNFWDILMYQSVSIVTSWKVLLLGTLGLNAFNHPWTYQVSYFFPPELVPLDLSKFLAEHVTSYFRFDSIGTILDNGSMAFYSSQDIGRHSLVLSHCKRSHCGCLGRPGDQGSVISTFSPLAGQNVLWRQGFSSSVWQAVMGISPGPTMKVF